MKRSLFTVCLLLTTAFICQSQMQGQLFQGTIKQGSASNSVKAVIKSPATFSGKFSAVEFTFQIPNTVSPKPTVSIKNNPLSAYIPTASYVTTETNEGGFYNYLFAATPSGQPTYNFTAGTEIDALEVQFNGANGANTSVRLASLANGGSNGQQYFYIEVSGNNNTNTNAMFYGTGASNGGSNSTYSYVALNSVVLPIKLTSFNATANACNAYLNWQTTEQTGQTLYVVERSENGTDFKEIGHTTANNTNTYSFTDKTASPGTSYYRIKLVDADGKMVYSTIKDVSINCSGNSSIIVYPTLTNGVVNIKLPAGFENAKIRVLNALGEEVVSDLNKTLKRQLNIKGLSKGAYLVQVINNGKVMDGAKVILQ